MQKFLSLLKYLDRSKITPEAVVEIAVALGREPSLDQAAEVSKLFRTRGIAGLLPVMSTMLEWPKSQSVTTEPVLITCPNCGRCFELDPQ